MHYNNGVAALYCMMYLHVYTNYILYPQNGFTPLHIASDSNRYEVIQLLLQSGAKDIPTKVIKINDNNY